MIGLVLSKWIVDQNNGGYTPALNNYLFVKWNNVPRSKHTAMCVCVVEAEQTDFDMMQIDNGCFVLWTEANSPETVITQRMQSLARTKAEQVGLDPVWVAETVVKDRLMGDVANDIITYLEVTA